MEGPWSYYGKGFDVCFQLLWGSSYYLGKGRRLGIDNRYTSCDLLMHLKHSGTNAFGTVRKGTRNLPDDEDEMFAEVEDYNPGEYQSRFSKKAGLVFKVIKSNKRVRVLTNCHSSTDETELERHIAEKDNPDEYEEAPNGRRKINTSTVLRDYSTTMNFTDCGAATGGRLTKFHRHSVRQSSYF